jgi:predicted secreted Zn-dependent protease
VKLRWGQAVALLATALVLAGCGGSGGFIGRPYDDASSGIVIATVQPQRIGDTLATLPGDDRAPPQPAPSQPQTIATPTPTRVAQLATASIATPTPSASATPSPNATSTVKPSGTPTPAATTVPAASQLASTTSCSVVSPPSAAKVEQKKIPGNNGTTLTQTIETKTYAVNGCGTRDILASLNGSTSASSDGRHEVGLTSSTTKYSFSYVSVPNACKIQSANIETQITVTLPELVNTSGISADVLAKWQTFLQALRTHEQGHVDIILNASTQMQAAFEGVGSQSTCQSLETTLKSFVQQQTDASNQANADYDTRTNHGVNQGVAFN